MQLQSYSIAHSERKFAKNRRTNVNLLSEASHIEMSKKEMQTMVYLRIL